MVKRRDPRQDPVVIGNKVAVPVTARALIQRINRKLEEKGQVVKAPRGARAKKDLGDYFVLDVSRNRVAAKFINLEKYGQELGVLEDYEALAEGSSNHG